MLNELIEGLRGFMVRWRWARFYRRGGERTWLHEPPVRRYVNQSVTGSEDRWPMDWFAERCATAFRRGLSLGCGEGALERDVVGRGICAEILGIDLLEEALERARDLAREAGLQGITYRRADMNRLELDPGAFDVVFFHQSLHHVENLEGCLEAVRRALVPGGTIYLDEYVGPSRDGWDRPMLADAEAAYARLPRSLKRRRRIAAPIDRSDPSEAVRSADILPVFERHFRIVERRDYGGNLLALIHPYLRHVLLAEPRGEEALEMLIDAERELLARGVPSYYTVVVGEPQPAT
jgi:SAM-dependent methyltransferase